VVGDAAKEGGMGQFGRITEAKREATRAKRIGEAVAWLAEGKARNWKYM